MRNSRIPTKRVPAAFKRVNMWVENPGLSGMTIVSGYAKPPNYFSTFAMKGAFFLHFVISIIVMRGFLS